MRKSKKLYHQVNPAIALVVDGKTEIWYLQMLKRNERKIRFSIKPEIPNRKSIEEQYCFVCDLASREYSKVFWIVDLDSIIKETREAPKGAKTPLEKFIEYKAALQSIYENVSIIVNNPCLEFWFLLHFEKTSKYFDTCATAEHQLKNYLNDYEKTQKYYTKQDNDIYLKLKPRLNYAIKNSLSLGEFNEKEPYKAMCEMESFFVCEELKRYFEN